MSITEFLIDVCSKLDVEYDTSLILYLAPNHQLLDLDPIEKDDLLVLGRKTNITDFQ